jgi:hypothetical protein
VTAFSVRFLRQGLLENGNGERENTQDPRNASKRKRTPLCTLQLLLALLPLMIAAENDD